MFTDLSEIEKKDYMDSYRFDERECKQINPTYLLNKNNVVWLTFLMKVYYKSLKYMIRNKSDIMRACQHDSDWENINISFIDWLIILNDSMKETIIEKKIRIYDQALDLVACMEFTLTQMIIMVSELFCLRIKFLRNYEDSRDTSDILINWKNHYHPKQICSNNKFIRWIYDQCLIHHRFDFQLAFLPKGSMNSITTFDPDEFHWFYMNRFLSN